MCDTATLSTIEEVVRSKVQNNELFTAFDVTLAVQTALKGNGTFDANVHRHRHLKEDVHNVVETYVSGGQYQRNLQSVGAPTPAFVYYPTGGDPSKYVPLARNDGPAVTPANDPYTITVPKTSASATAVASPATTYNPTANNVGDGLDNVGRSPDARGTLTVPSYLLRAAGFGFNDQAYVYADGNRLVVSKQQPPSPTTSTAYTVDHSCNVRITKAVLEYAGLSQVASFDFDGDTNGVYVREHK
jgi:hypothetical protein